MARGVVVVMVSLLVLSQRAFPLKPPSLPQPPAPPIQISLAVPEPTPVEPTPPPEPTPVELPPPPPPPNETPMPVEPPPPPKPVEKPRPVEKPKPVKPTHEKNPKPVKLPTPEAKPTPEKQPVAEKPTAPVSTAPPKPAAPPAPPAPVSNPSHEAAYISQVRLQIEQHKIYPALARKLDMSGTVEISYTLNRQGKLVSVEIVKTSGSEILDKAALQAVRAALFPPIPEDAWREDTQKQFRTSLIYALSDN
ncbi:MAG: energy transducer TonB [Halothiobacillus sp.]